MIILPFPRSMGSGPWGRGPDLLRECLKGVRGYRLTPESNGKAKCLLERWNRLGGGQGAGPAGLLQGLVSAQQRPGQSTSLWANARKEEATERAWREPWGAQCQTLTVLLASPAYPFTAGIPNPFSQKKQTPRSQVTCPGSHDIKCRASPLYPSAVTGAHGHASGHHLFCFSLSGEPFRNTHSCADLLNQKR